ncbi:MAG: TetR/AcrR family transcriptional regulator [Acidobacteria bacterium]|nr:TetR/AcrR family transcriptional regulator [Acidobacteriota bacterium]
MIPQTRAANRESLRRAILDAARPLFVQDGYEATSIRVIAAKAGCSPGILYHYFEDKQAIMAELVAETFASLGVRLRAIQADKSPVLDRFRRGLRTYMAFGLEHPHHYSLLFLFQRPRDWEGHQKVREVFATQGEATFACLWTLAAEAIEAGILRPELQDSEELAQSLWVAIHGLVSARIGCSDFPWVEQTRLVDRLVDVLVAGIERRT